MKNILNCPLSTYTVFIVVKITDADYWYSVIIKMWSQCKPAQSRQPAFGRCI